MDWVVISEVFGAVFALASITLSLWIMARVKRGASAWIYLGITSFCLFFAMILGIAGTLFPVNQEIQRLEQYIFLLAGALSFAISGIKLQETFTYKEL
jgi:hypothetical protein